MSREFTCSYANCQKTTVPIVCTMQGERARYCCIDHAMMGIVRRAWITSYGPKASAINEVEKTLSKLIGDGK